MKENIFALKEFETFQELNKYIRPFRVKSFFKNNYKKIIPIINNPEFILFENKNKNLREEYVEIAKFTNIQNKSSSSFLYSNGRLVDISQRRKGRRNTVFSFNKLAYFCFLKDQYYKSENTEIATIMKCLEGEPKKILINNFVGYFKFDKDEQLPLDFFSLPIINFWDKEKRKNIYIPYEEIQILTFFNLILNKDYSVIKDINYIDIFKMDKIAKILDK